MPLELVPRDGAQKLCVRAGRNVDREQRAEQVARDKARFQSAQVHLERQTLRPLAYPRQQLMEREMARFQCYLLVSQELTHALSFDDKVLARRAAVLAFPERPFLTRVELWQGERPIVALESETRGRLGPFVSYQAIADRYRLEAEQARALGKIWRRRAGDTLFEIADDYEAMADMADDIMRLEPLRSSIRIVPMGTA